MPRRPFTQFLASTWEVLEVALVAAATVFVIRSFLVQPFLVSGASMEPSFSDGNYLLVDEVTYRFREPTRGDVIVFRYPLDRSVFFIKRIIGMPNERVVARDGAISIERDGETFALDEPYRKPGARSHDAFSVSLGENQYFVMGDNRAQSFDSRNWGAILRSDIIGLSRVRVFPLGEFELISSPVAPPASTPLPS